MRGFRFRDEERGEMDRQKKIAQLTKVIFHLHSKNEENQTMQTAI